MAILLTYKKALPLPNKKISHENPFPLYLAFNVTKLDAYLVFISYRMILYLVFYQTLSAEDLKKR